MNKTLVSSLFFCYYLWSYLLFVFVSSILKDEFKISWMSVWSSSIWHIFPNSVLLPNLFGYYKPAKDYSHFDQRQAFLLFSICNIHSFKSSHMNIWVHYSHLNPFNSQMVNEIRNMDASLTIWTDEFVQMA